MSDPRRLLYVGVDDTFGSIGFERRAIAKRRGDTVCMAPSNCSTFRIDTKAQ
jgi:hypothetical protein